MRGGGTGPLKPRQQLWSLTGDTVPIPAGPERIWKIRRQAAAIAHWIPLFLFYWKRGFLFYSRTFAVLPLKESLQAEYPKHTNS